MIEVMVAVYDVRQRLVGPQLSRFCDHGKRPNIVLRRLDQGEVIAELDNHAVMRLSGEVPDAFCHFLYRDIRRRRTRNWRCRGGCSGRGEITCLTIDTLFGHPNLSGWIFVRFRREQSRKAKAGGILIVGESRFDSNVSKVRVVAHRDDARWQLGRTVNRQSEFQIVRGCDIRSEEHTSELQSPYDLV